MTCPTRAIAAMTLITLCSSAGSATGFEIESSAFEDGGEIATKYTCEGQDLSFPLSWSGVPDGAKSLVLVVDDPDAPGTTWVHWLLYDLPARDGSLPEGVDRDRLPAGTGEGQNDWKRTGYGGPCPPTGRHRYFVKLYALDTKLDDLGPATQARVAKAMRGHILQSAQIVGTYQKHH